MHYQNIKFTILNGKQIKLDPEIHGAFCQQSLLMTVRNLSLISNAACQFSISQANDHHQNPNQEQSNFFTKKSPQGRHGVILDQRHFQTKQKKKTKPFITQIRLIVQIGVKIVFNN